MKVMIASMSEDGTMYAILENQSHHPVVGEHVVLSSGRYVVTNVIWMYNLVVPNITIYVSKES